MKRILTKSGNALYRLDNGTKIFKSDPRSLKILSFDNTEKDAELDADGDLDKYIESIYACTLNDAGEEVRILATQSDPNVDSQYTGDPDYQCMVKFPRLWYKYNLDANGDLQGFYVAGYAKAGYTLHPVFSWGDGRNAIYIGMYEAYTDTSGSDNVLCSISGNNPTTNKTMALFRTEAEQRGSGWHQMSFWTQHLLDMLFYANYETRHSQVALPGYTESSGFSTNYIRECGRSNVLTDMNGSVPAQLGGGEDDDDLSAVLTAGDKIANRFLFIENIFGHIWKFNDGVTYVPDLSVATTNDLPEGLGGGDAGDGYVVDADGHYHEWDGSDWQDRGEATAPSVLTTPDIRDFTSVVADCISDYEKLNVTPVSTTGDGEIQKAGRGFVPTAHNGNTLQNFCARFYGRLAATDRPYLRVVLTGGLLNSGAVAGVACRYVRDGLGHTHSSIGSRLCFSKI